LSEYAKNVGEKESSTKRMAQSTLEDGTDMKQ